MCNRECNGCPWAFTEESERIQNYGCLPTPQQAHQAWLCKKLEICEVYLKEFKGELLVVKGLNRVKDKIQHHIDTNTELKSF